jgi:hypothetical protein
MLAPAPTATLCCRPPTVAPAPYCSEDVAPPVLENSCAEVTRARVLPEEVCHCCTSAACRAAARMTSPTWPAASIVICCGATVKVLAPARSAYAGITRRAAAVRTWVA